MLELCKTQQQPDDLHRSHYIRYVLRTAELEAEPDADEREETGGRRREEQGVRVADHQAELVKQAAPARDSPHEASARGRKHYIKTGK